MSEPPLRYESTRGDPARPDFADVLLRGLAPDGGLYVPESYPAIAPGLRGDLGYDAFAVEVMWPYVAGTIEREAFASIVADAYATFRDDDVVPLRRLDDDVWIMELFWGPTLAFKDVALQLVGRLFDHELAARGERVTIIGATSGDTGSAAIEACRDRDAIDIVILYPRGRVSDVQRRQMTTVDAANVHAVAVEGTFDDCQDLVKALFADQELRDEVGLSAVNSINWARVLAQIVYYVRGAVLLGEGDPVAYAVPTGNFGNVFAGYVAREMGAPIDRFLVGSNRNDILTRFFASGELAMGDVVATHSPSMDIQVSSNLERLLYDMSGRDGDATAALISEFRRRGSVSIQANQHRALGSSWRALAVDDEATLDEIRRTHSDSGVVLDPHTAIAVRTARELGGAHRPTIAPATAHPSKFAAAVTEALGWCPELPEHLAGLHDAPERTTVVPNDLDTVRRLVRDVHRGRRLAARSP